MNTQIKQLVPAVVSYVNEHGGYVTKTKLLKLLYLFDVEYYRKRRRSFTGFGWKFFHLGPWAKEFDSVVSDLVAQGVLVENPSTKPEYDTKFFRTDEPHDFGKLFSSFDEESTLRHVLNTWAASPTGEILDYVYFRTEPMEHGVRNEPLDFSVIPEERPDKYVRSSSGASAGDISKQKRQFEKRLVNLASERAKQRFHFTAPRYDAVFFEAIEKLDASD